MLEIVVFAFALVAAQVLASFVVMKLFMSKPFIKKWMKMTMEMMKEAEKAAEDLFNKEET